MSEEVRPFEEYKEMIQDMRKEEMIKGLYDLSARVIKQENIIKELESKLYQIKEYARYFGIKEVEDMVDGKATFILD